MLVACGPSVSPDAGVDGGTTSSDAEAAEDAGPHGDDAAPADAGTETLVGCRVAAYGEGALVARLEERRAPDGRLVRVDHERSLGSEPVSAWVEALAWDAAGRVTEYRCVDDTFGLEEAWHRETRGYRADGRPLFRTVMVDADPPRTTRWVYEGDTLVARALEVGGVEVLRATVALDLAARTAVATFEDRVETLAWNADGTIALTERETAERCERSIARYEGGFVVDERTGPCGDTELPVTYEHAWLEAADEARWTLTPTAAAGGGGFARRSVWPRAEPDVELQYTARRPSDVEPAVFEEDTYLRLRGCGNPAEPAREPFWREVQPLLLHAAPVVWSGDGQELPLEYPFRPR